MSQVKSKMTGQPPKPQSLDSFIMEAETLPSPPVPAQENDLPWQNAAVRADVIKSVNLRLPEDYILKLQYISQQTHKSQQALIREALLPYIDQEIERLTR